jgi:hypothetical protein
MNIMSAERRQDRILGAAIEMSGEGSKSSVSSNRQGIRGHNPLS